VELCLDFETDYTTSISLKILSRSYIFKIKIRQTFSIRQDEQNKVSRIKIGDTLKLKIEKLTLKMKISFDEILPHDVFLYVGTQNSSFFSILGGVLDQNVFFSTFDLENYCQGQTFS
jgi:hypothetical protein